MIYNVDHQLYATGAGLRNTIRTGITLTEPINGDALREAVEITVQRFPYFMVRIERHGEDMYYVQNNEPLVITADGHPVKLNSEESNYHLLSFSFKESTLFIDTSHFLTDGVAKFPFVQLLLYAYLHIVHPEEEFDTTGIPMPGDEISEEESVDTPYPDDIIEVQDISKMERPAEVFKIDNKPQGYQHMDEWTSYFLRIPQKEMMGYASEVDGSPASFIACVLYRAISDLNPDNHLPIVCGMQHQFRKALGNHKSHSSHVIIIPIVFPDSARDKDVTFLNTLTRGTIILSSDEENDKIAINQHVKIARIIKDMSLEQKCKFMGDIVKKAIGENTFEISYVGRVKWGGLDKYIKRFSPVIDVTLSGGISVEIFSLGEYFELNIMQSKDDDRYVKRFKEILAENNISCYEDPKEKFEIPGFEPL